MDNQQNLMYFEHYTDLNGKIEHFTSFEGSFLCPTLSRAQNLMDLLCRKLLNNVFYYTCYKFVITIF